MDPPKNRFRWCFRPPKSEHSACHVRCSNLDTLHDDLMFAHSLTAIGLECQTWGFNHQKCGFIWIYPRNKGYWHGFAIQWTVWPTINYQSYQFLEERSIFFPYVCHCCADNNPRPWAASWEPGIRPGMSKTKALYNWGFPKIGISMDTMDIPKSFIFLSKPVILGVGGRNMKQTRHWQGVHSALWFLWESLDFLGTRLLLLEIGQVVPEKYPGVNSSSVNFRPELNLATYLNDFNYYLRINVQFLPLFSHLNMGLEISAAPPIRSLNSSAGGRNSNGARSWHESNLLAGGLRLSAWQKGLSGVPVVSQQKLLKILRSRNFWDSVYAIDLGMIDG